MKVGDLVVLSAFAKNRRPHQKLRTLNPIGIVVKARAWGFRVSWCGLNAERNHGRKELKHAR